MATTEPEPSPRERARRAKAWREANGFRRLTRADLDAISRAWTANPPEPKPTRGKREDRA